MSIRPVISGRFFLPWGLLSPEKRREATRTLKYTERQLTRVEAIKQGDLFDDNDDDADEQVIYGRDVTQIEFKGGRYGASLPRAWAMENFKEFGAVDATIDCSHGIKFPAEITPRDDNQDKFFSDLEYHARQEGPQDILAIATTGSGKSVAGIALGQRLGQRTLIIVDQNKIASGWIAKNFHKFYGEKWTNKYVGRIQQDVCEYEGRAYSIAMAQTLARREYEPSFYRQFGLVLFDEIQVFGGPHFAKLLGMFPARVRVGFTAEERSRSFKHLIRHHLGRPRVISSQEVLRPICYMLRNKIDKPFYCENDGALLTNLSRVQDRNEKLARLIKTRGYDRDRNVLVLSNRTEHLVRLRQLCVSLGVPAKVMGLHMAQYESGEWDVCYRVSDGGNLQRLMTCESKSAAQAVVRNIKRDPSDYQSAMPKALYNRLYRGETPDILTRRTIRKPTQAELDHITNTCQIVFATYEIFSKGVDVPRLDMGVEALPSGNVRQPIGRILRVVPGKSTPEWYAIDDMVEAKFDEGSNSLWTNILNHYFRGKTKARVNALNRANARISYQ
jgi:superfamily II DNA or RNA helicase